MKKVLIYSPYWSSLGGGEKYVLMIAHILSMIDYVQVIIYSTSLHISKDKLEKFYDIDLSRVNYVTSSSLKKIREEVKNASIFIYISNFRKFESNSKWHIQLLQVPFKRITSHEIVKKILKGKLKDAIKDIYRIKLLKFAREKANLVITNSSFVNHVLERNYNIKSVVICPPIQDFYSEGFIKRNIILSVGRFFSGLYNNKRYDLLTEAFKIIFSNGVKDWEYHIIGSVVRDRKTKKMIANLLDSCRNYPIYFHFDEPHESLKRYYNEASIFWHAAGFGVDESKNPENVEHFGMTTVEAMSAYCIPVVINKGGQKEIIRNGVNGFLWDSIEDLVKITNDIIKERVNINNLRENARERFNYYSVPQFKKNLLGTMYPFLLEK